MNMTREEFNEMIAYMIDILREADDGDSTDTVHLCRAAGYEEQDIEPYDYDDVHMALFKAAVEAGIELDMSAHAFKFEGQQFTLDFVIHNKGAQYKCPHCGSTNTARILYGMPAFDDDLQSKLDSGKVVLGGCLIQMIEKDGQTIIVNPDRKCNDCGTEFSTSDNGINAD